MKVQPQDGAQEEGDPTAALARGGPGRRGMKRASHLVLAAVVIGGFGALRVPLERALEAQWNRLHLRAGGVNLSVREQLGQLGFVAALGGFRSLVASYLSLEAFAAWENVDWAKLEQLYNLITTLQPRVVTYWDDAGWHLGYNASAYYRDHEELQPAVRVMLYDRYVEKGKNVLREGIRNNPEDYLLYQRLADIYRGKDQDHAAAAEYYGKAMDQTGAPGYLRRFHAYELAECPGREREAYEALAALYREGEHHRKPTLLGKIRELEQKLGIPPKDRILPEEKQ